VLALALAAAACVAGSPAMLDGVTILRYGLLNGSPAALITGTIDFRDGCVFIDANGEGQVVIWPSSTTLQHAGEEVVVVAQGLTLHDRDVVKLGGGQYSDVQFVRGLTGSIPDVCLADLYWLASSVEIGVLEPGT